MDEPKILYTCDRRACESCAPECRYTRDISHAEHFERRDKNIVEKGVDTDEQKEAD